MLERFKLGGIKPEGWLLEEMRRNLEGFVGELDNIVPEIIRDDEIYGRDRLTNLKRTKDIGVAKQDKEWEVQYLWWNSESQSNWLDGLVRHSYLTGEERYMQKARRYIERVLDSQDEDGYIGIYGDDLRFKAKGENGELWAQSSFFRAAVCYFELSGDMKVLERIERAFEVTMREYCGKSNPFDFERSYAGVSHGITFTDSCYRMYCLTGDVKYLNYAKWLLDCYNAANISEVDIKRDNLLDYDFRFKGHGVHTYEGLRSLLVANLARSEEYGAEVSAYLHRLNYVTVPSGAPIGDEWIWGRSADPTFTGYEFCSIHELLDSYTLLLEITGELRWADRIEWLLYNGAYGAMDLEKRQVAYCKTDNSYVMNGHNGGQGIGEDLRYKYSSAHQDVAVCCVPNAGRTLPSFTGSMFMKLEDGILAALYGPCRLETYINGTRVTIVERTAYPFEHSIELSIVAEVETEFTLYLRKPSWATGTTLCVENAEIIDLGNMIGLRKRWKSDMVKIHLYANTRESVDLKGNVYYSFGPLLYALEIPSTERPGREYRGGYRDTLYLPIGNMYEEICATEQTLSTLEPEIRKEPLDFLHPPRIKGFFRRRDNSDQVMVELRPIGGTILRRVTFEKLSEL
jgi:hypothetical protein